MQMVASLRSTYPRMHALHALHQCYAQGPENRPRYRRALFWPAPRLRSLMTCTDGHTCIVPFIKVEEPYDEIKETVIEPIWDWWMEEGKNRERLGRADQTAGAAGSCCEVTGFKPVPQHGSKSLDPILTCSGRKTRCLADLSVTSTNSENITKDRGCKIMAFVSLQDIIQKNRWRTGLRILDRKHL